MLQARLYRNGMNLIELEPGVRIEQGSEGTAPLSDFDVVIIVEPDPEDWGWRDDDEDADALYAGVLNGLEEELDDLINMPVRPSLAHFAVLDPTDESIIFFGSAIVSFSHVTFHCGVMETDDLERWLRGFGKDLDIAILGAVLEDDVVRVANFVRKLDFGATIIERHCLPALIFLDIAAQINRMQSARRLQHGLTRDNR